MCIAEKKREVATNSNADMQIRLVWLFAILAAALIVSSADARRSCGCNRCDRDEHECPRPVTPRPDVIPFNGLDPGADDDTAVIGLPWATSLGPTAFPTGPSGLCEYAHCPNILASDGSLAFLTTRTLNMRAWTTPRSGTLSHLRANVYYGVNGFINNTVIVQPGDVFGNLTITLWTAAPEEPYTESDLSVTTNLVIPSVSPLALNPAASTFATLDVDLSDNAAAHALTVPAGTRVVALMVLRNQNPPFISDVVEPDNIVSANFWISGGYEFA